MSVVGKGLGVSSGKEANTVFLLNELTLSRAGSLPQGYAFQLWSEPARDWGRSTHCQDLTEGLRNKLNAIAARNKTLSNNTAHKPNLFH